MVAEKFTSLYVPMIAVHCFGMAMVACLVLMEGGGPKDFFIKIDSDTWLAFINNIFAFSTTDRNVVLSFLRDVFVSLIIIRAIINYVEILGAPLLIVMIFWSFIGTFEPVILRPNIFLFCYAGAFIAQRRFQLEEISSPQIALSGFFFFWFLFQLSTCQRRSWPSIPVTFKIFSNAAALSFLFFG